MEKQGNNAAITERFKRLNCPESEKKVLHKYLMSCLADGKAFLLKRNRVMVMDKDEKNKFVILDKIDTTEDEKQVYICRKCSNMNFSSFLTSRVSAEEFKSCVHTHFS